MPSYTVPSDFIPLENTLLTSRDADQVVAFNQEGEVSWHQWQARTLAWQENLSQYQESRWAVFHSDSSEFSAILFALWSLNKTCVIPGINNATTTVDLLNHVDGFIGQFDESVLKEQSIKSAIDKPYLKKTEPVDLTILEPVQLASTQPLIEIFTSGSSGKPLAIPKTLDQLGQEIQSLEQLWGAEINHSRIVSTVSHQHIYGLLFRVLWPICAQRAFCQYNFEFIEDLSNKLNRIGDCVLISSPTHLSRLPQGLDTSLLRQSVKTVFSSGAPLNPEDSQVANVFFQANINEVFGSSETGGIAWRQQYNDQFQYWQPLPNITFRIDQQSKCLEIKSPHIAEPDWYLTSDLAQSINDSSFKLLGRSDKIVKIEGKRLSITAMENRLSEETSILEARVITLDNSLSNRRIEIGAAIVLTEAGQQQLAELGRRAFSQQLKNILLTQFERPLLPRRWRFVKKFKRNSQSKVLHQDLVDLFMQSPPPVVLPVIVKAEQENESSVLLHLIIPKDLQYFDGHFEKHPILPGVVQTHWAEHYSREYFSFSENFSGLSNIKFQQIITPGQTVTLSLNLSQKAETSSISFIYSSDSGKHASGKLNFN